MSLNNDLQTELTFIKIKNWDNSQSNNILNFYINLKSIKFIEKKDNMTVLIFKNNKEFTVNSILSKFLKNYNIYNFEIYLVLIKDIINNLNIKVSKIFYNKRIESRFKYYNHLNNFLKNHSEFKLLLNQNLSKFNNNNSNNNRNNNNNSKKNQFTSNLQIKIKNFFEFKTDFNYFINLFLLFGNIKNIYFEYWTGYIYINYDSIKSINRVIDCKEDWKYLNRYINITISRFKKKNISFIKIYDFNQNLNLYNKNFWKIKYNSPNNKIIICNIDENLKSYNIYKIFSAFGKPLLIKFLDKKINKNTNMCIIQFGTISESINVIINMNNKTLEKYNFKISFTYNEINIF